MFKLTGDFGELERLRRKLDNSRGILVAASRAARKESLRLIKRGYATQTDPYGDPWTPKLVYDGRKTLTGPTRELREGWKPTRTDRTGFELTADRKAIFHQSPIKRKRRKDGESLIRMQIPEPDRALPHEWEKGLEDAIADVLEQKLF